jgi:hypothetical protein
MHLQVGIGKLHVQVMKQAGHCPLFFVPAESPGEDPHDCFGRVAVVQHTFILDTRVKELDRFLPRHNVIDTKLPSFI